MIKKLNVEFNAEEEKWEFKSDYSKASLSYLIERNLTKIQQKK